MRILLSTVLATACALAWLVPVHARVITTERTKTYPVGGKTGKEIARAIVATKLRASNTAHAIAITETRLDIINLRTAIRGGRCVVTNVDVKLDLIYTLPRWRDRERASPAVRKAWDRFVGKVERHELKHGAISKQFARRLNAAIRRSTGKTANKCRNFGARQAQKLEQLTQTYMRKHQQFDRREGRSGARVRRLQQALIAAY